MKRKHEPDLSASQETSSQVTKKLHRDPDSIPEEIRSRFRPDLFDEKTLLQHKSAYAAAEPYHHGIIPTLISDTLLRSVREEIRTHISFTPKETDIYKIQQSGDLANLDGLESSRLKHLPSLVELRDALYSAEFRSLLEDVTGAGKLSGKKTDMAVNIYMPGSYLLCHDDVIGSRRVSYILYLTDPDDPWKSEWGGGLRLYDTEVRTNSKQEEVKVPKAEHARVIPPSWGQLSFFAVQPGESFHDVEEVHHSQQEGAGKAGERVRMAISGWYHIPQEGEDGFEEGLEEKLAEKSSLSQLEGQADEFDEPRTQAVPFGEPTTAVKHVGIERAVANSELEDDETLFTETDLNLLLRYISPSFLTPDMTEQLAVSFEDNSFLQIDQFLCPKFANALRDFTTNHDGQPQTEPSPSHDASQSWKTARPPHKHRYLYQQRPSKPTTTTTSPSTSPSIPSKETNPSPVQDLLKNLFPSHAFQKWLSQITNLTIDNDATLDLLARRFRRGKDYALASSYNSLEPRLEYSLGFTPSSGWVRDEDDDGDEERDEKKRTDKDDKDAKDININIKPPQQSDPKAKPPPIEFSGEEVYMAGDESDSASASASASPKHPKIDPAVYSKAADDEEADSGILFTDPPAWNRFSIVLRDRGTLRFVKYISRAARGDRWDIKGVVEAGKGGWGEEEDEEEDASTVEEGRSESGSDSESID